MEKLSSAVVNMSWLAKPSRSIERGRSCLRVGAERVPVLAQHDLRFVEVGAVAAPALRPRSQPAVEAVAVAGNSTASVTWRAVLRLEMLGEEARHFHDVRIGVVNDAPAGVGHCSSGSSSFAESLA